MQFKNKLFLSLIGTIVITVSIFGLFYENCTSNRNVIVDCVGDPTDDLSCGRVLPGHCTSLWDIITDNEDISKIECDVHFKNFQYMMEYDIEMIEETKKNNGSHNPTTYYYNNWCKDIDNTNKTCFDIKDEDELFEIFKKKSYYCSDKVR